MGMVLVMRRVDDAQLAMLRADPEQIAEFAIEDEAAHAAGDLIDFDKAWHALHFTLTGEVGDSDSPLSLMRNDAVEIGADIGYGPAKVISAANMRAFHEALAQLSDDELKSRYDPAAMAAAGVYLSDSLVREGDDAWEYVMQGVPALRRLAEMCARTGSGAIVAIT